MLTQKPAGSASFAAGTSGAARIVDAVVCFGEFFTHPTIGQPLTIGRQSELAELHQCIERRPSAAGDAGRAFVVLSLEVPGDIAGVIRDRPPSISLQVDDEIVHAGLSLGELPTRTAEPIGWRPIDATNFSHHRSVPRQSCVCR